MPVPAPMSPGMKTPSPAATPTGNPGAQAHAAQQVKQALLMLETALPQVELSSPLHGAVRSAINGLAKHLPASGGQDQGIQQSMLRDLALRQQQTSPMLAAMQARGAPGGGAPAPGGGGAPPSGPAPASPGA